MVHKLQGANIKSIMAQYFCHNIAGCDRNLSESCSKGYIKVLLATLLLEDVALAFISFCTYKV